MSDKSSDNEKDAVVILQDDDAVEMDPLEGCSTFEFSTKRKFCPVVFQVCAPSSPPEPFTPEIDDIFSSALIETHRKCEFLDLDLSNVFPQVLDACFKMDRTKKGFFKDFLYIDQEICKFLDRAALTFDLSVCPDAFTKFDSFFSERIEKQIKMLRHSATNGTNAAVGDPQPDGDAVALCSDFFPAYPERNLISEFQKKAFVYFILRDTFVVFHLKNKLLSSHLPKTFLACWQTVVLYIDERGMPIRHSLFETLDGEIAEEMEEVLSVIDDQRDLEEPDLVYSKRIKRIVRFDN